MSLTTDPNNPKLGRGIDKNQVPQNEVYLVLSEDEISKGFIRPVRTSYVHIGKKIKGVPESLSKDDIEKYKDEDWVAFAKNPDYPAIDSYTGTYLTKNDVDTFDNGLVGGCGAVTVMNQTISETYARNPKFYGSTYCMGCKKHLDVNEFIWDKTNEKVGS